MKKLLIIGFVLISSMSFASSGVRVNSGSISLGLGDHHRGGSDVTLVLSVDNERDHYRRDWDRRYVEREVYRYRENNCGPRYRNPPKVTVINDYRGNNRRKPYKYNKKRFNNKHKKFNNGRYDSRNRKPQEVVVINKYDNNTRGRRYHNAPYKTVKTTKYYNNR